MDDPAGPAATPASESERLVIATKRTPLMGVVSSAVKLAREISGLGVGDFARKLQLTLGRPCSEQGVQAAEAGLICPAADYLIACGQLCETPVSVLLGELDIDESVLDRLQGQVDALTVGKPQ